jgi:hypothetical protein
MPTKRPINWQNSLRTTANSLKRELGEPGFVHEVYGMITDTKFEERAEQFALLKTHRITALITPIEYEAGKL